MNLDWAARVWTSAPPILNAPVLNFGVGATLPNQPAAGLTAGQLWPRPRSS